MIIFPRMLSLLFAVLLGAAELRAQGADVLNRGTLVVANREGGSVSFLDLEIGVEVARLPVGPHIPHEVAVSPDGRWVITSAYGGGPGRHLVVLDLRNPRETGRIDLGERSGPHSMAFLADNRRAVATMEESDRIALVDVVSLQILRTYPTGGREGHMVRLSPDERRAYITSRGAEGTLSVIFLEEQRDPVVIPTGAGAEGLAVSPDGGEVWVANRDADTLSVVDTETFQVVATLEARPDTNRIEITASGLVLAPNASEGGAVAVYDLDTQKLLRNVPLRKTGASGGAFGIFAHGTHAFIADRSNGDIVMLDPSRPEAPSLLIDGRDSPDGMAWSPLRVAPFE